MKLLFKALFRLRRERSWIFATLGTLIGLTLATHLETLAFGLLSDSGVDFFKLFASEKGRGEDTPSDYSIVREERVTYDQVAKKWHSIDREGKGISLFDAETYLSSSQPGLLKKIFYQVKRKFRLHEQMGYFILYLMSVALIKAFFLFFSRYTIRVLGIKVSCGLRQQYFDQLQLLPMDFYQKHTIGSLASRVANDSHQISISINSMLLNYVHAPFKILTTLVLCFIVSWQLSFVIFFGLPLIIFPVIFVTRKVKQVMRQLQKNQEKFTSVLVDFLAGIQTVKVFSMEKFSLYKYSEQNNRMASLEVKTAKYDLLTRPILHTITMFCLVIVVLVGLHVLSMKIAELVVFIALLHQFYEPVKKFAEENANIQKGVVAAERMEEIFIGESVKPVRANQERVTTFSHNICFDRVWFKYQDKWVLENLCLEIRQGEMLALVGPTGAGKSTLVSLLTCLYDWNKGEISLDGTSIRNYSRKSMRELIAFVPQKPFLFQDTIAKNIAYGRPLSREVIAKAAARAHADAFIEQLPQGYDTLLSESGKNLSGGQQQRLAIARALAKNAPILILDEATSALDSLSEEQIKLSMQELKGNVTQIVIAHRLSTVENADRIAYLENGKVVAIGKWEELLAHCSSFRAMWEAHSSLANTLLLQEDSP